MNLKGTIIFSLFLCLENLYSACSFSWIPTYRMAFQYIDENACVNITEFLGSTMTSQGDEIALFVNFNSARKSASNTLGLGWWFNATDCTLIKSGENTYSATFPDANIEKLTYDKKSRLYKNKYWILESKGNQTLTSHCGERLSFKQSKLASIRSSSNEVINFSYVNNKIAYISDSKNNLISFEYISDESAIIINFLNEGKRAKLHFKKMAGRHSSEMLSDIQNETGITIKYAYNYDNHERHKITRTTSNNENHEFEFNASDGTILNEKQASNGLQNSFNYTIDPNYKNNKYITRISTITAKKEVHFNNKGGLSVAKTNGGPLLTTHYFVQEPLAGKPRRIIETYADGKKTEKFFFYDSKGRIVREIQDGKILFNLKRNDKDNSMACFDGSGNFIWKKVYDNKGRIILYELPNKKSVNFNYLEDGRTEARYESDEGTITRIFSPNDL